MQLVLFGFRLLPLLPPAGEVAVEAGQRVGGPVGGGEHGLFAVVVPRHELQQGGPGLAGGLPVAAQGVGAGIGVDAAELVVVLPPERLRPLGARAGDAGADAGIHAPPAAVGAEEAAHGVENAAGPFAEILAGPVVPVEWQHVLQAAVEEDRLADELAEARPSGGDVGEAFFDRKRVRAFGVGNDPARRIAEDQRQAVPHGEVRAVAVAEPPADGLGERFDCRLVLRVAGGIEADGKLEGCAEALGGGEEAFQVGLGAVAAGPGVDGESVETGAHGAADFQFRALVGREGAVLRGERPVHDPAAHKVAVVLFRGEVVRHLPHRVRQRAAHGRPAGHVVGVHLLRAGGGILRRRGGGAGGGERRGKQQRPQIVCLSL